MGRIRSVGGGGGSGSGGITSLNALVVATQLFAVGTTGTDFNISSVSDTHTFNIPSASATARGLVTTGTQTFAGAKTLSGALTLTSDLLIQEQGGGSDTATIQVASLAASRTYTMPDAGGAASFVMTAGAQSIAGIKTFSDTTDASSATVAGTVASGGLAVAKKIYSGTGINVVTGNVLITSGTLGRDTGVSGSQTDCPTNCFTGTIYVNTDVVFGANSATVGTSFHKESTSSISWKSGGATQITFAVDYSSLKLKNGLAFGSGENGSIRINTTVTTTDATPTALFSLDQGPYNNFAFNWFARVIGRKTDGTEWGRFTREFTVTKDGGGAVTLKDTNTIGTDYNPGTWGGVDGNVSSSTFSVRGTGKAATTIHWWVTILLDLVT